MGGQAMPFTGDNPYGDGPYEPQVATDLSTNHPRLRNQDWALGQPRPEFYDDTYDQLLASAETDLGQDPDGNPLVFVRCGTTKKWITAESAEIGHKTPWER